MRLQMGALVGSVILLAVLATRSQAETLSSGTPVMCNQDALYVGQNLVLVGRADGRLFKATDTGWRDLSVPASWDQLAVVPDGETYHYNSTSDQIQRSTDSGETWQIMGQFPYALNYDGTKLSASPISGTIFIGMGTYVSQYRGIFKSIDAGVTWSQVLSEDEAGPVSYSPTFAQDGTAFSALTAYHAFVGVRKTTDYGDTWQPAENGLCSGCGGIGIPDWVAVSPQYSQDHTAFTASVDGLYLTTNGGSNWTKIKSTTFWGLVFSPMYASDRKLLVGGYDLGLYLSRNSGQSFAQIWNGYVGAWGVRQQGPYGSTTTAPAPSGPYRFYLPLLSHESTALEFWMIRPTSAFGDCYLYRSRDEGATWEEVPVLEATHWSYLPVTSH
ncbi:hypothetical protein ANRL3_01068 [Anaerolineae bacterium]|nr:hypothetical protein ANRL3_01068 [Anaerolineae bacterium]